jgi:V-type H+-transporting ATPase subunit H
LDTPGGKATNAISTFEIFFQNLVEKAPEANLAAMAAVKLLPFCENLSTRKWSDAEILEDVNYLKAELEENFHTLT